MRSPTAIALRLLWNDSRWRDVQDASTEPRVSPLRTLWGVEADYLSRGIRKSPIFCYNPAVMPQKPRTEKMKKLAQGVRKGLSLTAAGKQAGYANRQAASRAFKVIKLRFHPALEAAGYDVDKEITKIYRKLRSKMDCKETIWAQSGGVFIDHKEVIPHAEQRAAANDCARFLGIIGNGHDDKNGDEGVRIPNVVVQVAITGTGSTARTLEVRPADPSAYQQPVLDVEPHEDARRPGPEPAL